MGNRIDLETLPQIAEWMSLPDAADALKLSRQQVHRLASSGEFKTLSRIGTYVVVDSVEVFNKVLEKGVDKEAWRM